MQIRDCSAFFLIVLSFLQLQRWCLWLHPAASTRTSARQQELHSPAQGVPSCTPGVSGTTDPSRVGGGGHCIRGIPAPAMGPHVQLLSTFPYTPLGIGSWS